jgi:hypothetical protein
MTWPYADALANSLVRFQGGALGGGLSAEGLCRGVSMSQVGSGCCVKDSLQKSNRCGKSSVRVVAP